MAARPSCRHSAIPSVALASGAQMPALSFGTGTAWFEGEHAPGLLTQGPKGPLALAIPTHFPLHSRAIGWKLPTDGPRG